jgi:hypothetical protein
MAETYGKEGLARSGEDRVWKAFIALDGAIVSTTDLIHRTFPRKQRFAVRLPSSLIRLLEVLAVAGRGCARVSTDSQMVAA